ncbi:MAG: sigma-70 family RNA polymerase sigma factor [Chryseobacterium sp.]|uniref:RNA polymerase sigma factor n=1 Tax=Chryseobacterium sp. TaxID=1871047 RepID=UPI0025BA5577|nr:sigma-70 family RNA polymerase sigma factor [Chryseobacterium sp.]MCJ7935965.1 sigma-70 family RNA polymerase sigma factor [Chryseobacterium sp.]
MFSRSNRANEAAFFRAIFEKYSERMFSFIFSRIRKRDDVLHVLQGTFIHLWKYRKKLKSDHAQGMVFKACRQEIFRYYKEKGLPCVSIDDEAVLLIDETEEELEFKMEKERMLEELYATLNLVPEKRKAIFIKNKLEGITEKAIAEELHMSKSAVENQISKVMHFLKRKLQ